MDELKIGADPEFFVRRGFHFVSGHRIECGDKFKPTKTEHGAIQNDGLAVECNIRPSSTREEFIRNCEGAIQDLTIHVQRTDPLFTLVARPSVFFGAKFLAKVPRHARELGCNADFDAHELAENERPNAELPFRTGSGHVHIGWTKDVDPYMGPHIFRCAEIAKELDFHLGLASLSWDRDARRRILYGKAGAFRPKPYGCEYRTLSNTWLNNKHLMGKVFDRTVTAYRWLEEGRALYPRYGEFARDMINNNVGDWYDLAPELAQELDY